MTVRKLEPGPASSSLAWPALGPRRVLLRPGAPVRSRCCCGPLKKDIPGLVPVAQPDKINMVNIFTNKIRQQEDETGHSQGHPPSSLHGVISPRDAKSNSHEELPQLRDYPAAKYDLYI